MEEEVVEKKWKDGRKCTWRGQCEKHFSANDGSLGIFIAHFIHTHILLHSFFHHSFYSIFLSSSLSKKNCNDFFHAPWKQSLTIDIDDISWWLKFIKWFLALNVACCWSHQNGLRFVFFYSCFVRNLTCVVQFGAKHSLNCTKSLANSMTNMISSLTVR